jgi:hypothetical protein
MGFMKGRFTVGTERDGLFKGDVKTTDLTTRCLLPTGSAVMIRGIKVLTTVLT